MSNFKVGDRVVIPKGTPYDPKQAEERDRGWGTDWDVKNGDVTGEIIDISPSGRVAVLNDDPRPPSGWPQAYGHVDYLRYADEYEPQPYDMPSPEADALDRIADVVKEWFTSGESIVSLIDIRDILQETGRL